MDDSWRSETPTDLSTPKTDPLRPEAPASTVDERDTLLETAPRGMCKKEGDRRTNAKLINFNNDDASSTSFTPSYTMEQSTLSKYDMIQNQSAHMTKEEMEELMSKFGAQDFQEA